MRILGLLSLLLSLTFSARATLVPGGEKPVTAPARDVAAFDQSAGKLASDGDSFLAVWIDHTEQGRGDIHAARITPEGKRVEDDPIVVAATDDDENRVDVAYGGGRYLVVWSTPTALRARFVAGDRSMSDVIELSVVTGITQPRVAFNGNRFLVIWDAVTVFRGALFDIDGGNVKLFDVASTALAGSEGALVAANGKFHFVTALVDFGGVPNGNGYPSNVGYTTIDENGVVSPRVLVAPATTPVFDVRAVSSGSEFVIGWSTAIAISGGTVRAVRVGASGASAIETIPAEDLYLHDVGVDASGFFVIYGASTIQHLRRLGTSQSTIVATPDTETTVLDVARNSARAIVLVMGNDRGRFPNGPNGGDLYLTRLDTGDIEPLAVAPRHQVLPDIAAAGELRLAAWSEYIGSDRRIGIVASRLDASGNTIDSNGIDLHANPYGSAPRVASNGTDWLVVWFDFNAGTVFGSRVAHDGTLLDATPFVIQRDSYAEVAVSWDGAQYVVVLARGVAIRGLRTTVIAKRVTAQGVVVDPASTLSGEAANTTPSMASSGDGSLIVWRSGDAQGQTRLQGVLLSRTGTVTPVAFSETIAAGFSPAVAWNGSTYLVAAKP